MSNPSTSDATRKNSQSAQSAHPAGGDLSSRSSKPQNRPVFLRGDSSKSTRSQSSLDTTGASTGTPYSRTQTLTPRTPFTPSALSVTIPSQTSQFRVPASPRSATMTQGESAKAAKVAIPRLKRSLDSNDAATKPGGRHRVTHACEPCRHRKTKCSGERPTCRHCQDFKIQCYYADGKRDRVKNYAPRLVSSGTLGLTERRQFGSMAEKVADYEKILRDLQTRVSEDDANLIKNTLDRAAMLDGEDQQAELSAVSVDDVDPDTEGSGAESEASGTAGSTGALDRTDEDFTREGARTTGFMGKNSEITWMQRLRHENKYGDDVAIDTDDPEDRRRTTEAESGFTVQDTSYHLNDLPISPFEAVDPYELPTEDHAHKLFSTYMNRVHPTFPVVGRINLQNQFAKFLARPTNRPPPKWLAIINMIFAIAAKYSHLIQADWRADERDHLIFFARARLLAVDAETMFNHPDLQSIQIFGLMSCYLLATEQINRAWMVCGTAVRAAICLGLNMRNESSELPNALKEIRYRVWWALYTLEHRLCTMTGRGSSLGGDHCTTPLPVPVTEDEFDSELGQKMLSGERQRGMRAPSSNSLTPATTETSVSSQAVAKDEKASSRSPSVPQPQAGELEWARDLTPNSALFFLYLVHLSRITQEVFERLYNPSSVNTKWSTTQITMHQLNLQVESWYRSLPPAFHFGRKQRDRDLYESRLALGFYYYSTKQMINRPCLCRLDRKIPGQSNKSNEFNHAAAIACVNAARDQLQLIPDEPNSVGLLRSGPWLTILHMLVQTSTVLMLEISFRGHHMPEKVDEVLEDAKKAVRWLHALGDENLAAARAWDLCHQMLIGCAKKVGRSVDDMPSQRPRYYPSPRSDVHMMNSHGMFDTSQLQSQNQQNHMYSQPQSMPPMTTMEMAGFGHFTAFDQMMQYDRAFQNAGDSLGESQMAQDQSGVDYSSQIPSDVNMNFMNPYGSHNQGPGGHSGSEGGRGGMSGYG